MGRWDEEESMIMKPKSREKGFVNKRRRWHLKCQVVYLSTEGHTMYSRLVWRKQERLPLLGLDALPLM